MSTDLTHESLTPAGALEAERTAWDTIVDEEYDGNPFLSMDWNLVWLRHFPPAVGIAYVKLIRGAEPVGYFPLVLTCEPFHGFSTRVGGVSEGEASLPDPTQ